MICRHFVCVSSSFIRAWAWSLDRNNILSSPRPYLLARFH